MGGDGSEKGMIGFVVEEERAIFVRRLRSEM